MALEGETPERLTDLAFSLKRVGSLDKELGQWEAARVAYAESLEIRRRLLTGMDESPLWRLLPSRVRRFLVGTNETPEALRALSIGLCALGGIDLALGRWESARTAYTESVEIDRRLLALTGEDPEALLDLSISLFDLGNAHSRLGESESARAAYAESLAICRRLLVQAGETPKVLGHLSNLLKVMGDSDADRGNWDVARATYTESLAIARRLVAKLGESPETLIDLASSLNRVGNAEHALGQWEAARVTRLESLEALIIIPTTGGCRSPFRATKRLLGTPANTETAVLLAIGWVTSEPASDAELAAAIDHDPGETAV